jgi:cold shock CspA family protein
MAQGTIRDYDTDARTGSLLQDDHTDVAIDPVSVEGAGIRTLRVGQRVVYDLAEEGGRRVARNLRIITFS